MRKYILPLLFFAAVAYCTETAIQFNGSNQYVRIPHSFIGNPSGSFTVETWARIPTQGASADLISKHSYASGSARSGYFLEYSPTSGISAGIGTASGWTTVNGGLLDSTVWNHLAMVFDNSAGSLTLYVNGVSKGSATGITASYNTLDLYLGASSYYGNYFRGILDEVRVWNTTRTVAQIQSGMDAKFSTATGLFAYYSMNEGQGDTLHDSTGNDHHGIRMNMVDSNWILTGPKGSGTASDPYLIATLDDLKWVSKNSFSWSSTFVQTADIDASGTSVWNSGAGFSPIGNNTTSFTGTYHGRGHVITGLTINRSTTNFVGLFGRISAGTIDSLGLENVSVTGATFVGALIGFSGGNMVSQCYSTGAVTGTTSQIGGLVGGSGGAISNSYSVAKVSGVQYVGGVTGYNTGTVANSYASGLVTGTNNFGGLIGYGTGTGAVATNSFYNGDNCSSGTSYATAKTTAQLWTKSTFTNAGWNFTSIWSIDTTKADNGGFPMLSFQPFSYKVITNSVKSISLATMALAGGIQLGENHVSASVHGFCWNNTGSPTLADHVLELGEATADGLFLDTLSNLSASTTYYVRAYAIADQDTVYGNTLSLTTQSFSPQLTAMSMKTVRTTWALASSRISWLGKDSVLDHGFCWSLGGSPGLNASCSRLGSLRDTASFADTIKNLPTQTKVYARAFAITDADTVYSDVVFFQTGAKGSGTAADPYRIETLEDLKWLSEQSDVWASTFVQTEDIDASKTSTWNSGAGFSPIGNNSIYFTGTYHGHGHVITGLTVNRSTTNFVGLFGRVSAGTIDSLGLENVSVTGATYVGALIGFSVGNAVSQCYSTGALTGTSQVGGLVGGSGGTISNSYSIAQTTGGSNIGGLVGYNTGTVAESYSAGSVTGSISFGGLIGTSTGTGAVATNSFYNSDSCSAGASYATPKTTAELRADTTLLNVSWDLTKVWSIDLAGVQNGGFPFLVFRDSLPKAYTISALATFSLEKEALHGTFRQGNKAISKLGFCWNTTGVPTFADSVLSQGVSSIGPSISDTLKSLSGLTTYYVRACAVAGQDTAYGRTVSFSTPSSAPAIITESLGTVYTNWAVAKGRVTWLGKDSLLDHGFCWSRGALPVLGDSCLRLGSVVDTASFSDTVTGLPLSSKIYLRAFATTGEGTFYGDTLSFWTDPSGSGTTADPYQIASLADLKWVSEHSSVWSKTFVQTANIDASETSTWNSGAGFSPIGDNNTYFSGTYHGHGHVIKGLTIHRSSTNFVGLFGRISAGTIDSLGLENVSVTGATYVGALIGFSVENIVSQCYSTGDVSGVYSQIGGLVGGSAGMISNSYSKAKVTGGNYIGGVTGYNTGTVTNSYSTGVVTGGSDFGGLIGIGNAATNSFYNSDSCSAGTSHATPKTTAELRADSAFANAGWALGSIWNIDSTRAQNNGFPFLAFQYTPAFGVYTYPAQASFSLARKVFVGALQLGSYASASGHGFCWNTSGMPTLADHVRDLGATSMGGFFSDTLENLSASTTYFVRAFAVVDQDTVFGKVVNFSVLTEKPEIATKSMGTVYTSWAVANGRISWLGKDSLRNHGFCWSLGTAPVLGDSCLKLGAVVDTGSFSDTITRLPVPSIFYLRAFAISNADTVYGDTVSFTTTGLNGSGTTADPYRITSLADLKWLSEHSEMWSKTFIQTVDINAAETSSWNSGAGFSPIGNKNSLFTGTYHGHGHIIVDLTINRSKSEYVGLFGRVGAGRIDSLGLVGVNINGQGLVGALIGSGTGNVVSQCYVTGTVKGTYTIGGLIGSNSGAVDNSFTDNNAYVSGTAVIGGLIGFNGGSVTNSYANGGVAGYSGLIDGCLIGSGAAATNSFYYDYNGTTVSTYATPKSLAELQADSTYAKAGWDMVSIWSKDAGMNNRIPLLGYRDDALRAYTTSVSTIGSLVGAEFKGVFRLGSHSSASAHGFCWNTTGAPTLADSVRNLGTLSSNEVSIDTLEGLSASTTYYVRAYLIADQDTVYGSVKSISTLTKLPEISTEKMGTVYTSWAVASGHITWLGKDSARAHGFCWSKGTTPILGDSCLMLGSLTDTVSYSDTIQHLSAATQYFLRAFVITEEGISYGNMVSFRTGPGGAGTTADPYRIASLADLKWLSEASLAWTSTFEQTADIDAAETSSWNSGAGFSPIGNGATYFSGTYHGRGHMITGLTVNRGTTNFAGLFGRVSAGIIDSLGLESVSIMGSSFVGGLIGFSGGNTVNQCYSTGAVTGSTSQIGGLVGGSGGAINNSYSTAKVTGVSYVGGVTGYNTGTVAKSYASGLVTGTSNFGGLIGYGTGTGAVATNSFYNSDSCTAGATYATAKTTAELRADSAFINAGWEFGAVWAMDSTQAQNNGFPFLAFRETSFKAYTLSPTTSISLAGKVLKGAYWLGGHASASAHGFCWNTTGSPTLADNVLDLGILSSHGYSNDTLKHLLASTTYFVRAYAIADQDTVYGKTLSFSTLTEQPEISTDEMGVVYNSWAVANGRITWLGQDSLLNHGFCWSKGATPILGDSCLMLGSAVNTGSFSDTVTGLPLSSKIYLRAFATTDTDTVYGDTVSFTTTGPGGSGTSADPYVIASLVDLEWVSEHSESWSKTFVQTADIDASETSTWNGSTGFSPIGNNTTYFTGTYHGHGHVITGLTISRSTTNFVGLFGRVSAGIIDSLGLENVSIKGSTYVGALIGFSVGNVVRQSYSTGTVTGSSSQIGGLVGGSGGTISNSYSIARITGGTNTGGLVGYNTGTVANSYSTGRVTGSSSVGGLLGISTGSGTVATNSFYNSDSCTAGASYATAKTTAELRAENTFKNVGWDMASVWSIDSTQAQNKGFPLLAFRDTVLKVYTVTAKTNQSLSKVVLEGEQHLGRWGISSQHGFCWNTTGSPTVADHVLDLGTASGGLFRDTLWNLSPSTTYYARAFTIAGQDTAYGKTLSFSTLTEQPQIFTDKMGTVASTWVVANGRIAWFGKDSVRNHGFCWSKGATPILGDSCQKLGLVADTGSFSDAITGLSLSTQYFLRTFVTTDEDTFYGSTVSFRTGVGGSGTTANPYQIATLEDLKWLSENSAFWSSAFVQTADIDASETSTWNGSAGFSPIGNAAVPFTGSYNGRGHIILGLSVERAAENYVGLFGYVRAGVIDSLGLSRVSVTGHSFVGGLVGYTSNTSLTQNCYSSGTVSGAGYYIGGLVGYIDASQVARSYSTGRVSGRAYVGGLTGRSDYSSSSIINSYSTVDVSGSAYTAGFVGYSYKASLKNNYSAGMVSGDNGFVSSYGSAATSVASFWDIQTSGLATSHEGTGYTTVEMKNFANFTDWDFASVWAIRKDSTYPALRGVDNAPFAFADTVVGSLSALLANDYDYETMQKNLVLLVDSAYSLKNSQVLTNGLENAINGDSLFVRYRVGEMRSAHGDTLWGNTSRSFLKVSNATPVIVSNDTIKTNEDLAVAVVNSKVASDTDGDHLSFHVLVAPVRGTVIILSDSLKYAPIADASGLDSAKIWVSDGFSNDSAWIYFHVVPVNDAPVLASVRDTVMDENKSITLPNILITATDAEGDAFSILVYAGANYTLSGTTVTPTAAYVGTLAVPVAVTDGRDTSNVDTVHVTVYAVSSSSLASSSSITSSSSSGGTTMVAILESANVTLSAQIHHGLLQLGYALPRSGNVTVEVFSLMGQKSLSVSQGMQGAGFHALALDVLSLHAGHSIVILRVDRHVESIKTVVWE